MKTKKLTALLLAGLMAMSLVTSAFATSTTTDVTDASKGATVKVTGESIVPTIKLVVPNGGKIVLNPYAMKIKATLDGKATSSDSDPLTDKVLSAVNYIENQSDVAVKVGVTVTGTAATGVTFAKASVAETANKDKQVFVQLVMKSVSVADYGNKATTPITLDPDDDTKLTLSATAVTLKAEDQITLDAGTGSALSSTGTAEGILAFQFQGDTSATPTTPWTNRDTVGATLAFTFAPQDVAAGD